MPISVEQLFKSYGSYLRAKVQEKEFGSFGGGMADAFRKQVADHQALEAQYLAQLRAERQASDAALKANLDAYDAAQKPRRLR